MLRICCFPSSIVWDNTPYLLLFIVNRPPKHNDSVIYYGKNREHLDGTSWELIFQVVFHHCLDSPSSRTLDRIFSGIYFFPEMYSAIVWFFAAVNQHWTKGYLRMNFSELLSPSLEKEAAGRVLGHAIPSLGKIAAGTLLRHATVTMSATALSHSTNSLSESVGLTSSNSYVIVCRRNSTPLSFQHWEPWQLRRRHGYGFETPPRELSH
nr:hypothetical protein Iba_chr14cCG6760 [Ipomoea batatas]